MELTRRVRGSADVQHPALQPAFAVSAGATRAEVTLAHRGSTAPSPPGLRVRRQQCLMLRQHEVVGSGQ
jgi:hypothetical protein